MSTNITSVAGATHADAAHFGAGHIDLKSISEAEARKLMSAEHKALGYRPPPGSLAAEAQAAAAKHPNTSLGVSAEELRRAALVDAERIKEERAANGVDLSAVGEAEARKLMSEEHKALGHRPPPGSLAAQAQSAAAKHPQSAANNSPAMHHLQRAALEDAVKFEGTAASIDLNVIGEAEARRLMSEEHKALGYRPPPGSLAAEAQAAAAKHPDAHAGIDATILAKAALEDAKKIESTRRSSSGSSTSEKPSINLNTTTVSESREIRPGEQNAVGYRPPSDSVSVIDKHADVPVMQGLAPPIQSQEQQQLGYRPESRTIAITTQNLVDENEADGGQNTFADASM